MNNSGVIHRAVGFSKWKKPFASDYLGVDGNLGRFLGFWSVLLQACFSFFGSEVPGIVRMRVRGLDALAAN